MLTLSLKVGLEIVEDLETAVVEEEHLEDGVRHEGEAHLEGVDEEASQVREGERRPSS